MADWKQDLQSFFDKKSQQKVQEQVTGETNLVKAKVFVETVVMPAFLELKEELAKHGKNVQTNQGTDGASLSISEDGSEVFRYSITVRGMRAIPETRYREGGSRYVSEGYLRSGGQDYTIEDIKKDEIIRHFLEDFKNHQR